MLIVYRMRSTQDARSIDFKYSCHVIFLRSPPLVIRNGIHGFYLKNSNISMSFA